MASRSIKRKVIQIQYHCAVGDQTDKGMRRKQTQADHQRILQGLEIIFVHTSVHHVQEDGRDLGTSCKRVFNGGMFGQQLGWEVGVGNIAIMRRELVAMQTERADPEFSARINLAIMTRLRRISLHEKESEQERGPSTVLTSKDSIWRHMYAVCR